MNRSLLTPGYNPTDYGILDCRVRNNIRTPHANDSCWSGFSAGLIFFDERQRKVQCLAKSESSALSIEMTGLKEIHASNA